MVTGWTMSWWRRTQAVPWQSCSCCWSECRWSPSGCLCPGWGTNLLEDRITVQLAGHILSVWKWASVHRHSNHFTNLAESSMSRMAGSCKIGLNTSGTWASVPKEGRSRHQSKMLAVIAATVSVPYHLLRRNWDGYSPSAHAAEPNRRQTWWCWNQEWITDTTTSHLLLFGETIYF